MAASVGMKMVAFVGRRGLVLEFASSLAQMVKPPFSTRASTMAAASWVESGRVDGVVEAEVEWRFVIVARRRRTTRRFAE